MLAILASFILLPNAHAHNDYAHSRPLLDALDQGFLSVEADIFLVDGELRVGHNRADLKSGRTLESLYLEPLAQRVRTNNGTVYGQPGTMNLLVDIKADGPAVQAELNRRLPKYRSMLSERTGSTVNVRAVQVVLSGARTADCAATDGFLFKDGLITEISDESCRTPLISGSYGDVLKTAASPLPPDRLVLLHEMVSKIHASNKRFRLWAAPDQISAWSELRSAKVDLINTDRLAELRRFLLAE